MGNYRPFLILLILIVVSCSGCSQQSAGSRPFELEKEGARRVDEAQRKYQTADYQTAKSALLDLLKFLDQAAAETNGPEFRTDAMMTCVRLAKLEEKNHGSEQAAYMKQAMTRCQTFKFQGKCDEDSLRKEVDRLDALSSRTKYESGN